MTKWLFLLFCIPSAISRFSRSLPHVFFACSTFEYIFCLYCLLTYTFLCLFSFLFCSFVELDRSI